MLNVTSTRMQKLNRIRRALVTGAVLPGLFVFCLSSQAQTFKFSNSKTTTQGKAKVVSPTQSGAAFTVAKPSSNSRISAFKKPLVTTGVRPSRTNSTGLTSKPPVNASGGRSLSRNLVDMRAGITRGSGIGSGISRLEPSKPVDRGGLVPDSSNRRGNGLSRIIGERDFGISRPVKPPTNIGQLGGRLTNPGLQAPDRNPGIRIPDSVSNLPGGSIKPLPNKPLPDFGRLLPGRNGGVPNGGNAPEVPSITESNRKFENILGSISKLEPKPLDIKDLGKELPKLNLITKDKPELNMERQEMVLGARKTMMHRFGFGAGCHWWIDLLCGWHWHRHRCHWTDICAVPGYWSCWRPCHYRVVWCPTVHGHVRSAWYFGIESFLIPDMHALGVHQVSPYSPAALAGLQPGDMILSVNGYAFDNESVLPEMIQTSGGVLSLEVYREGLEAPMVVQVRLRRLRISTF